MQLTLNQFKQLALVDWLSDEAVAQPASLAFSLSSFEVNADSAITGMPGRCCWMSSDVADSASFFVFFDDLCDMAVHVYIRREGVT